MVEIGAGQVAERLLCINNRKKHVLAPWSRTPGAISPIFEWVRTVAHHLAYIPDFMQIGSGLGKL